MFKYLYPHQNLLLGVLISSVLHNKRPVPMPFLVSILMVRTNERQLTEVLNLVWPEANRFFLSSISAVSSHDLQNDLICTSPRTNDKGIGGDKGSETRAWKQPTRMVKPETDLTLIV
jgi:hypothetical protein